MFFEIILLSLFFFGSIMSLQDLQYRKVKNSLTISFVFLGFLLFVYSQFVYFIWYDSLILLFTMVFAFTLFHKKVIGAADGKIFIGIVLYLLSIENLYVFDSIINIIVLYVSIVILLIVFRTSFNDKKMIFLKTPFSLILFQTLFTLAFLALFSRFIGFENYDILLTLSIFIVLLFILSPIAKKLFSKLDENSQIVVSFILFSYAFYDLFGLFLQSFIYLFFIKSSLFIITELSEKIKYSRGYTTFPLIPIIFLAVLSVLFLGKNLILIFFGF